ncbi:uncharacterized protein LOC124434697 isoform X2 [Xenia sp. Carnegie-2017]|uniref:uncharacterized protein LOC124434697 isoform X2 n=1 Tax=Xenia sp. Carnegie-2017 TaxID=2897299 RepID=UPI001F041814|nr:uncharacterized protein LOC124434697 isoform X2 [Xenia sp. Carnegie-2017]
MAPVLKADDFCIIRYSSQDPVHRAENILSKGKKWLSNKDDESGKIEAEIHLAKSIKFAFINIGNAGSAIVELLVGSSMWSAGKNFITLLPSTMLMSPTDSKAGKNMEAVKMLDRGVFCKNVIDEKWDRLRVICRQPYTKNKQFGLQFIDIIADTKPAKESPNTRRHPTQSLSAFKNKQQVHSCPSVCEPLIGNATLPGHLSSVSVRSAGLVKAALKAQVGKFQTEKKHERRNYYKPIQYSPYEVDAKRERRKIVPRRSAADIEEEVECFLEDYDFEKLPLETMTYKNMEKKMEEQRHRRLTKEEKKMFVETVSKHVNNILATRTRPDLRKDDEIVARKPNVSGQESRESIPASPVLPYQSSTLTSEGIMKSPTSDSLHECPLCENFFSFETIELHASTCEGKATPKEETEVEKYVRSPHVDSNIVDMMEECKAMFTRDRISFRPLKNLRR